MTHAKWLTAALCTLALVGVAHGVGSPEKDYEILVKFRSSIKNWEDVKASGHLDGWDDATPAYLWSGIVLDFDLRVREINLPCYDFMYCVAMEGDLFPEFAKLDHLELLNLGGNHFRGDLPDEWAAPGAFPALLDMSLNGIQLNGTLPSSWGRPGAFPRLTTLRLGENNFTGPLPESWANAGALPSLLTLDLQLNHLTGSLPASWGKGPAFPLLKELTLTSSGASGELPPEWGSQGGFANLTSLLLSGSQLSGPLPKEWASPNRFPKLAKIDLRDNKLFGSLPPEWGCRKCWPALRELHLRNNTLSGSLPGTWSQLQTLQILDAGRNNFASRLPDGWAVAGGLPQLSTLSLTDNSLSGALPESWGKPEALPALTWLDLSFNNISGGLPHSWGKPNSFPRLRLIYLQNNHLSGPLPNNWTFNSTMQQLYSWSLAHNELTGTLPESWGAVDNSLSALYILDLGFNRLNGSLPGSWGTSRSALSSLTTIDIAGNNFTGEIPPNWGLMQDMHYLVLAPGNPTVCRTLPYVGQYVTCFGEGGANCQEPVQLRANCSSNQPGWVPYEARNAGAGALTGLQIGLIVAAVSLIAACSTLAVVLVLRHREQQRWQSIKSLDAELAVRNGKDPLASLLAATANRKRGVHSALAQKLLKECRIDQADIMFCRGPDGHLVQLGAGAYGQVYKAFLYGVHPVAVKVFQTQDDVPADDFWKEISILRTCRHNNIVQFQGACVDGDTTMMVTELMDTDLYRALQSNRVNWYKHGLDIAIDVAQALHFLHCRNIIHFDCKSPNILLSTTNSAKLADVGWAQILYHSYITGDGGTFNWAAPEQLIGLKCTAKADVYSYGLVLWELCTRELPVRGQIRDIRIPQEAPQMVADLIRECLDVDPAKRPTMEQIIHRLMAEKNRMANEGGSSSGFHTGPPSLSRHPGGSLGTSSAELPGLDIPGSSLGHTSTSDKSSGSGGGGSSSPGETGTRAGSERPSAAPRRTRGASSVDDSVWHAASTPPAGSSLAPSVVDGGNGNGGGAAARAGTSELMPVGSAGTHSSQLMPVGPRANSSLMPIGSGMPTASSGDGRMGGFVAGGPWHGGGGSHGGSMATATSSQFVGGNNGNPFEGSPWFAGALSHPATSNSGSGSGSGGNSGNPSVAVPAGSQFVGFEQFVGYEGGGGNSGGNPFEGSPWFTGNLSHPATSRSGGSGSGSGSGSGRNSGGNSGNPSIVAPTGSQFVGFEGSPWFTGNLSHPATSNSGGSSGGGSGGNSGNPSIAAPAGSQFAGFEGSWFAGALSQPSTSNNGSGGPSANASVVGGSNFVNFDNSPWAAGRPVAALTGSGTTLAGTSTSAGTSTAAPSVAGAAPGRSIFDNSPWFNGGLSQAGTGTDTGTGTSSAAAGGTSRAGSGSGGGASADISQHGRSSSQGDDDSQ